MTSEASFNKQALSFSSPTALLDFKDLSSHLTLSRWKGGVLEVKTVETFWNGPVLPILSPLTQSTGSWSWRQRDFRCAASHFQRLMRNSRLFSAREYLFYCAPHFAGITIDVFNPLTEIFRFEIFFPHDWCNSEVFCTFPSGKYYWRSVSLSRFISASFNVTHGVLLPLARVIFRGAYSFAISENN